MMSARGIRIGVIGCGWHSRAAHGPSLKQLKSEYPELGLAACCDIDEGVAESYRADYDFDRAYSSFEAMLAEEQLDAVWVLVPEQLTAMVSMKVMDAGVALLLEKPPGVNTAEVIQLAEYATEKGIKHRVAFNRRHVPLVRKLIAKLQEQEKQGKHLYSMTYDMIRVRRTDPDFSTTAIHAIDAARWIAGADYESLRFRYDDLSGIAGGLVNIAAEGTFRNGIRVQLNCYPHSGMARELVTVRGEGFTYELHMPLMENAGSFSGLIYSEQGRVETIAAEEDWHRAFGFYDENASFLNALLTSADPLDQDLRSSIQSVEIMEAIRGRAEAYYG